jgi:hypothetical protein
MTPPAELSSSLPPGSKGVIRDNPHPARNTPQISGKRRAIARRGFADRSGAAIDRALLVTQLRQELRRTLGLE